MIREARPSDKVHVLEFCKSTFSWGDYIKDVWDYWLSEGLFFVAEIQNPVGICHAVFFEDLVWIEGIRIDPNFRRKKLASNLVKKIESIAKNQHIHSSLMLIDTNNQASLLMAKNLNYQTYQTWNFYSLSPKQNTNYKISFGKIAYENQFTHFVRSWRWIPLDRKKLDFLSSQNQIFYFGQDENKTVAILEESEHFDSTLIVTLYPGLPNNTVNVISFLQNYGVKKNYQRLQILTREILQPFEGLDLKISFHLMQKLLS